MAAAMKITLLAVAAMALLSTASAVTYDVGAPSGEWDLNTDYGSWVSDKKFVPGDSIVFKYTPPQHDVLEVSKADYDSCNTASPINTYTTGNDAVDLSATGTRYFICGIPGHCKTTGNGGMKVQIDIVAASSPAPPTPASGPSASNSPPTPASGPGASNSPPPPETPSAATSVRATAGLGLVVLLAGLMA
uniref:Uncharacterized protein n=1 Tax=Avena sativa TaxID=4498 RepID=A0ACD5ZFD7_AVESA